MPDLSPNAKIAQGRTAEVFAWEDDKILKLFYDWCPQDWIEHESRISQIVAQSNLPVPKWFGVVEVGHRQGIIYERVVGLSMLAIMSARPWLLIKYARLLAELHSEIHHCEIDGLESLQASLRKTILRQKVLTETIMNKVLALLEELPDGKGLCHFDFHPGQVMMTPQGPVVLDWMTAFRADPAADVARTQIILKVGQLPNGTRLQRAFVDGWKGLFSRIYLSHTLKLNPGISREAVGRWMVPVAAGRLDEHIPGEQDALLAIIQKGVHTI